MWRFNDPRLWGIFGSKNCSLFLTFYFIVRLLVAEICTLTNHRSKISENSAFLFPFMYAVVYCKTDSRQREGSSISVPVCLSV